MNKLKKNNVVSFPSHRKEKERAAETNKQVLDNIGELLFSSVFQAKLQHSTPKEIDSRVQNFLA